MAEVGEYVPLITQLRRAAQDTESGEMDGLLTAAADAIERLQARWQRVLDADAGLVEHLMGERDALRAEVTELRLTVLGYVQAKLAADALVHAVDGSAAVSVPHSDHTNEPEEQQ